LPSLREELQSPPENRKANSDDEDEILDLDVLSSKLPGLAPNLQLDLEQAGNEVQEYAAQHKQLEDEHMVTVNQWIQERNSLVNETGSYVIERAQGYYDCMSIWNQQVQEFARQKDEVDLVSGHYDIAVKNLSMSEAAFESYCMGNLNGDLPNDVWEQLVPLSEIVSANYDVANDGKLARAFRLSVLTDKVCSLQRQREAANMQLQVKTQEMSCARCRFEGEQYAHRNCTWNCSVKRASVFFREEKVARGHHRRTASEIAVSGTELACC
jgi:hypothetical protein